MPVPLESCIRKTHPRNATGERGLGILIVGGEYPLREAFEHLYRRASLVVAADSGFDAALELGIRPDYVVGDMDSCVNRKELSLFPRDRVLSYPQEKDDTDTEIGLSLLYGKGIEETVIIGGGGGRLDHLFAILSLFKRTKSPDHWFTRNEYLTSVDEWARFTPMMGRIISFFPLEMGCEMETRGLKWPLDSLRWDYGDCGVSNLGVADEVFVGMRRGRLLAVINLDERGVSG